MAENPIYVVTTEGTLVASLGAFRDREVAGLLAQVEEGETGEAMEVVELDLFESVVGGAADQLSFPAEVTRPRGCAWWSGLVDRHDWAATEENLFLCGVNVSDLPGVACVRCAG